MRINYIKKAVRIILIFVIPLCAQNVSVFPGNDFFDARIAFENSAGIALRGNPELVFSSQIYHLGLASDHLNNQLLSFIYPVYQWGTIGIRAQQFTSELMTEGTYTLMYAKSFYSNKIALGIHFNLHAIGYAKDRFHLQDPYDPVLSEGTSIYTMGLGLGAVYEPINDLRIGIQMDDVNRPDISLEGGKAFKPLNSSAGISYMLGRFNPEFKINHYQYKFRNEWYNSFGLNVMFLKNAARVSACYQTDILSFGAGATYNNLDLTYEFHYPLNELNTITSGSHVLSVAYRLGKPSRPEVYPQIQLITPQSIETKQNNIRIQATIQDQSGLESTEILLDGETVKKIIYKNNDTVASIDEELGSIKAGKNLVILRVSNSKHSSSKQIIIVYEPETQIEVRMEKPPVIELITPETDETNASVMRMKVSIEFILELKDIKVKVNGNEIQLRGVGPIQKKQDRTDMEIELNLEEGLNNIEVIAFNERGSSSERKKIRYNPITEPFYNKLWAVVIGIDKYQDKNVPDLVSAVKDAKAVESILNGKYRFDHVITLYDMDATRYNIVRAISAELKDTGENDGVFIFFAGHGCTGEGNEGGPLGFIVPSDGTFEANEFFVKNIAMSQIKEISQTIKAKHIFYAMDCCYGGLLLRGPENILNPSEKANYSFLRNLAGKRVRQVLAAGGQDQPAFDGGLGGHSVFTGRFIQGLNGEADFNHDGYITAEEIDFFVKQRVHSDVLDLTRGKPLYENVEQTPQYGKWFGEGDFIFGKL